MAQYPPPLQSLAIFDSSVFKKSTEALTQEDADKRYVRYPTAQGNINLIGVDVFGDAVFHQNVTITGSLTISTLTISSLDVDSLTIGSGGINSAGNVNINKNLVMNNPNATSRQTFASYYNLSDVNSASTSLTSGRLYFGTNDMYIQNFATSGVTNFTQRNSLGTDIIVLNYSTSGFSFRVPVSFVSSTLTNNRISGVQRIGFKDVGASEYFVTCDDASSSLNFTTTKINAQYNISSYTGSADDLILNLEPTAVNCHKALNMVSNTPLNRNIKSSGFRITESSGVYNGNSLSLIYQTGGVNYYQNLVNSGSINFAVQNSSAVVLNAFQVTYNDTLVNNRCTVKANLLQTVANTIIDQSTIISDLTQNIFKLTAFKVSYGVSSNPTAEFLENVTGRGLRIVCDAPPGSYSTLTKLNDSVIVSRFRPTSESVGLVLAIPSSNNCGIRIASPLVNVGLIKLQTGANQITMYDENDAVYPNTTTIATKMRMIGLTTDSRNIDNVGKLNLYDVNNGIATGSIYVNGPTSEIIYQCSQDDYKHSFYTGATRRFYVDGGSVNIFVAPTFFFSPSGSRLQIRSEGSGITDIKGENFNGINSSIKFTLTNSAGTGIHSMSIKTDEILSNVPIKLGGGSTYLEFLDGTRQTTAYIKPTGMDVGNMVTATLSSANVGSNASIRNIGSYLFANAGTYMINWNIYATADSGVINLTNFKCGIANTSTNSFDIYTFTYPSLINLVDIHPTLSTTTIVNFPTSCMYRATTSGDKYAYFNYLATFTGTGNIIVGGTYTITRIS